MTRRACLAGLAAVCPAAPSFAFGQQGAFHARWLRTAAGNPLDEQRKTALSHWAWELVRKTSAPSRLHPKAVAADSPELLDEPFCVWAGDRAVGPLMATERRSLRTFFKLGGVMLVDDADPARGAFGQSARRELSSVLPEVPISKLSPKHVIYKSYYLVEQPVGRVAVEEAQLDAMIRGRQVQVVLSSQDLLGALARQGDTWALAMEGGAALRQQAVRLAVNIAMYVLCSDYKDDQVHAEELMRRRGRK